LRELRSIIPASIPAVIFSSNTKGKLGFSLLPWGEDEPAAIRPRLAEAIRGVGKSAGKEVKFVLIIEDEPALSELLTRTLLLKGFQVLQAPDGRTGIELAMRRNPEVIVLDLTLPDCTGVEVVQKLRAFPATRGIPILIHTGSALNEDERQRLAGDVQAVTSKTDQGSLLAELDRLEGLPGQCLPSEVSA